MPFVPRVLVRAGALLPLALAALILPIAMVAMSPRTSAGLIKAQEGGFIEITLRTCPPGYDVAADGADPVEDCEVAADGIRFTLRDDDAASDDRRAETGPRGDGVAFFRDVSAGQYVLSQDVPDGVDAVVVVSCQGFNTGPFYRMPLHEGAELNIPVPNNAPIRCEWINILAPGVTPLASPDATPVATPGDAG